MSRQALPLTDKQVSKAKPAEKDLKLFDGGGLFLLIHPTGGKWWRYKYRFERKEKQLALGTYPEISLEDARSLHSEARRMLEKGIDPSSAWKEEKDREKADILESENKPHVRIDMNGMIEIWKGRSVVRLTRDEARFVKDLLILVG
jgi:hypothetical protein